MPSVKSELMKTMEEICTMVDKIPQTILNTVHGLDVEMLQSKQSQRYIYHYNRDYHLLRATTSCNSQIQSNITVLFSGRSYELRQAG